MSAAGDADRNARKPPRGYGRSGPAGAEGGLTMKLTATEFLTLDGVYQGPGGPDEDRRGGVDRGGWQAPIDDEEIGPYITAVYSGMDAMLLGRTTFDIWNAYWPHHDSGDPVSHGINVVPKYVPSTTLKNPTWQNTHVIARDIDEEEQTVKAEQ